MTHHTSTLHFPLEFLLELRFVLGSLGVEVLRRGAGNDALLQIVPLRVRERVGGSAGSISTLLRLYLDGCLFGCKCSRLSLLI